MLEIVRQVLDRAEASPQAASRTAAIAQLRDLGLYDFGYALMTMPNSEYPNLSKSLPSMAEAKVQNDWTGSNGEKLLEQSAEFVRSVALNFTQITGRSLKSATALDYGCGWGRLIRLMQYYIDPDKLYGVDPWTRSIEECAKCGLTENIFLSHYLPNELPVADRKFDLVYAFSVFTHTSMNATLRSTAAIRKHIRDDGLFVMTIRPVEYWPLTQNLYGADGVQHAINSHRSTGFAFRGHGRNITDGEDTYGETSMTLDWISTNLKGWEIAGVDRSASDAYQVYVFLRPV